MSKTCTYEIMTTLGVGGMATVYLARTSDARAVAVKKLHAFLAQDPSTIALLEDEARLAASIRHPNVVAVVDFVGGDAPALVMEWVDGIDVAKLIRAAAKAGRRLPIDVAVAIARDVLSGLHAAHEGGIVHRDVSPQNVLVGRDGVTRITDFGVAKAAWRQQQTDHGAIKGKLGYLAPEQLEARCDRRSDVYGLGVVLWELLTGTRLRPAEGVEVLVQILCGPIQAASMRAPEAACLDAIVARALERSPDDRFGTAAEMIAMLDHVVPAASPARVAAVVMELLDAAEPKAATTTSEVDAYEACEPTLRSRVEDDGEPPTERCPMALSSARTAPETRRAQEPAQERAAAPRRGPLPTPARPPKRSSGMYPSLRCPSSPTIPNGQRPRTRLAG